jgi:hypothetical protein
MQAQRIEIHDATHTPQRQALLVSVAAHILTPMREQSAAATYGRAQWRL